MIIIDNISFNNINELMCVLKQLDNKHSNNELLNSINCDNMSVNTLNALMERIGDEMKRKELLARHNTPIKMLPNGKWYTRLNGKKIERVSRKDLEDLLVKHYSSSDTITISDIFDDYLTIRKKEVADTTWQKDIRYYRQFIKGSDLETKPINTLCLKDGYNFINHCLQVMPKMKKRYWNNIRGFLNSLIQYMIDEGYIESNPFINLKPKKDLFTAPVRTRDGDTVFTKEEQIKVCKLAVADAISTNSSEPLGIALLFNLGIRDGELCALQWNDVETAVNGSQYIHVQREMVVGVNDDGSCNGFTILPHCKTPSGDRRLLLNDEAVNILNKIKEYNIANGLPVGMNDNVFLRYVNNDIRHCTPRSFDPRLRRYCRKAGMKVIKSPHDIRRTVLTNLYNAGMPLKKIQEFAGHASLKQTMDYIRISDNEVDISKYLKTLSSSHAAIV